MNARRGESGRRIRAVLWSNKFDTPTKKLPHRKKRVKIGHSKKTKSKKHKGHKTQRTQDTKEQSKEVTRDDKKQS